MLAGGEGVDGGDRRAIVVIHVIDADFGFIRHTIARTNAPLASLAGLNIVTTHTKGAAVEALVTGCGHGWNGGVGAQAGGAGAHAVGRAQKRARCGRNGGVEIELCVGQHRPAGRDLHREGNLVFRQHRILHLRARHTGLGAIERPLGHGHVAKEHGLAPVHRMATQAHRGTAVAQTERGVGVGVQNAAVAAVVAARFVGKFIKRRRLVDGARTGVVVVAMVVHIVIEGTAREHETVVAFVQAGVKQRRQAVGRERTFFEIVVTIVAAGGPAQHRIDVLHALRSGVGAGQLPIQLHIVTQVQGLARVGGACDGKGQHGGRNRPEWGAIAHS